MNRLWLTMLSTLGVCALLASDASAQNIITGPPGNYLRPGANVPFDGMPYSHRYGYFGTSPGISFASGMNRQQFEYLEYLDRVDRAIKFGYPLPKPYELTATEPRPRKRVRFGFGILFGR